MYVARAAGRETQKNHACLIVFFFFIEFHVHARKVHLHERKKLKQNSSRYAST